LAPIGWILAGENQLAFDQVGLKAAHFRIACEFKSIDTGFEHSDISLHKRDMSDRLDCRDGQFLDLSCRIVTVVFGLGTALLMVLLERGATPIPQVLRL
jgi:hypothetical protein